MDGGFNRRTVIVRRGSTISETPSQKKIIGPQPGDVMKWVIHHVTGEWPSASCACQKRANRMNEWGWWGCWKRRGTVTDWLIEECGRRGHKVSNHKVLTLIKAAFKELRDRRAIDRYTR